jgi:drug/metabolite transporter (DMT)-like permease
MSAGLRFFIAGSILFTIYYFHLNKPIWRKKINNTVYRKDKAYDSNGIKQENLTIQSTPALENKPKSREKITLSQWKDSLILGLTLFLCGQGLLTWGAQYLSSGMTGLLNSTIPLWVVIIGFFLYKWLKKGTQNQLTKSTIVGLSAGFGGLMLLVAPSIGTGDLSPIGTLALIISSIAWAIGSIYSTKAKLPVSILASSGMIMITGGLMLTIVSIGFGEYHNLDLMQISIQSILAQVYLIIIITIVGFTDFYWLLRKTSASLANTFAYVSPVIAVILGWLILGEKVTLITIIAMTIILFGVALMVTRKGKQRQLISDNTSSK